jgi:uncharacterized damage-inducible protein DinB
MTENILVKLFEHNNWANIQIIQACSALSNEQLDAEPHSATKGTIRTTLSHLINSEQNYLSQLMRMEPRFDWPSLPDFAEVRQAASMTGEGFIALIRNESSKSLKTKFQKDGYSIDPWVVMVQAINHSTEHREQIKSMLSALGITPPRIDGWAYGRVANALTRV